MICHPTVAGCVKINVDGSTVRAPAQGSIGGVFRDWQDIFLGGFSQNIGHATCLEAEICDVLHEIEKLLRLAGIMCGLNVIRCRLL